MKTITVQFPAQVVDINGVIGKMSRLKKAVYLLKNNWSDFAPIPEMISATNQLGVRINYHPADFNSLISNFKLNYTQIGDTINNTHVDKHIVEACRQYLDHR